MPDEDPIRGRTQITTPTTRDLAMVLFRRRRVFVCVSLLVFAAAVLYGALGRQYQANMKVLVRRGRADAPVSAGENAPLDLTRMAVTEEDLNSEVELLRDDDVLRTVVEATEIGDHDWLSFLRPGEGHAQRVERAARRLGRKLDVQSIKKTNLIAISYAADDAALAAKVLRELANVYLEKHMAVHRPDGEFRFLEQQAEKSRQQLEESKRRLFEFTSRREVVAAEQERDLALQKLSEMDGSARQTRVELAETQQRVWELTDLLAKLPERTITQVRTADNPELLKAMKATLLDLQLKRTELLNKFEPSHRLVQQVEQQIAQTQAAISEQSAAPVRDETTDKDAHYEWAKSALQQARVDLKAFKSREAAANAQATAYRAMAAKLGTDAVMQADLLATEKTMQENYLLYLRKQEEARMNDALDERGIVNVAIAEQPVAPALPVWSLGAVLAIGLVAAGAAGTGASFAADHLDPAFRDPDDVLVCLGAPVLASLPRERGRKLSA